MLFPSGTPTQPEIITIALSKLRIRPTDIFADIGCGSASVSICAAQAAKHVYAIDSRDEAIRAATLNIREAGVTNVSILRGEASLVIPELDIDCAFLGGSKNIDRILAVLMKKVPRFIVSAVRVETAALALETLKKNNVFRETVQIQLSRGSELAGGTMLKPENPVFLILGGSSCL